MDFDVRNILISISSKGIDSILIDNKSTKNINNKNFANIEDRVRCQLGEYFKGTRKKFSLPINYENCSEFSYRILKETIKIPYGETRTYSWLAKKCTNRKSYRAVGQVMRRNPFLIVIPCHRVISSSGELGGFSGGIENKKFLLYHEQNVIKEEQNE